jgi:nitrate/nitrite transporter NarK
LVPVGGLLLGGALVLTGQVTMLWQYYLSCTVRCRRRRRLGQRHLGVILGAARGGGRLGGFIGPFLGGWRFDVTGSYQIAFVAAVLTIATSAGAAWVAAPKVSV